MQAGPPSPYAQPPQRPKKSNTWVIVLVVLIGGAVVGLPVVASLAIYGVRRYLVAAKTSEAKNTIGAIARGAKQAYERESPNGGHRVCDSAVPVPSAVPPGRKYQPGTGGVDFDTGDAFGGWKCLRFAMTQPIYYRYRYTCGSSPITSAHGGSPAVSGGESFEAAAEGDLDGDGDTSMFALVGQADASHEMRIATQIYIYNEFE